MTYHSHKLDSTHSHIIGRIDPITGDKRKWINQNFDRNYQGNIEIGEPKI
ncbi:hypothetical protein ACE193_22720 [Bernardetia sp. OM2101]